MMRTLVLQDNFRLLPQAVLYLLETSAVTGGTTSSQSSLVVVKEAAVSYSLFLWPLCISWDEEHLLELLVCVFSFFLSATFDAQLSQRTFCDSGSRSQTVGNTSQPYSPVLLSNPMGLDFMAEHLWLLFCILSPLMSLTDSFYIRFDVKK